MEYQTNSNTDRSKLTLNWNKMLESHKALTDILTLVQRCLEVQKRKLSRLDGIRLYLLTVASSRKEIVTIYYYQSLDQFQK